MTEQHPITPPPELVQQWASENLSTPKLCNRAAQWGADQELAACCEALSDLQRGTSYPVTSENLQAARRPTRLKEQGIESLDKALTMWMMNDFNMEDFVDLGTKIRQALESLPE